MSACMAGRSQPAARQVMSRLRTNSSSAVLGRYWGSGSSLGVATHLSLAPRAIIRPTVTRAPCRHRRSMPPSCTPAWRRSLPRGAPPRVAQRRPHRLAPLALGAPPRSARQQVPRRGVRHRRRPAAPPYRLQRGRRCCSHARRRQPRGTRAARTGTTVELIRRPAHRMRRRGVAAGYADRRPASTAHWVCDDWDGAALRRRSNSAIASYLRASETALTRTYSLINPAATQRPDQKP